jgi:DNA-binding NarL/FixJ family response regulator
MDTNEIIEAIDVEIKRLQEAKALLGSSPTSKPTAMPSPKKPGRRKMSAAERARIAEAQKARWAKSEAGGYRSQATLLTRSRTHLSPKELAIVTWIMQGKRNKEIAGLLGTSEQVIKNYLRKVYAKLGVSDRLELALYCMHHQLHKKGA